MLKRAARPGELNPAAGDLWVALPVSLVKSFLIRPLGSAVITTF